MILNLLQFKNTRQMIVDEIARRDIQLVERICKVYTTRSDVSIKRRQDEFVMVFIALYLQMMDWITLWHILNQGVDFDGCMSCKSN